MDPVKCKICYESVPESETDSHGQCRRCASMKHADWYSLYILATNASNEARISGNSDAGNHYAKIANKCCLRADLAEKGVVLP